jgi:hypothetical protein
VGFCVLCVCVRVYVYLRVCVFVSVRASIDGDGQLRSLREHRSLCLLCCFCLSVVHVSCTHSKTLECQSLSTYSWECSHPLLQQPPNRVLWTTPWEWWSGSSMAVASGENSPFLLFSFLFLLIFCSSRFSARFS